ncbi:MAG TPA: MoaD/ThiS family protein [Pseudomonadales bacterium]|nr:MoaD/ThiS family protein [Pseudomonadales bacterium]MDP6316195.1 MoaD/ThiS family protein [Pseudomonadales bacterium]MDP7316176.1 MoaD/ThiS family protein [Pseudomonadales bacterium]MDP7575785.1 MoaD/ThiS family protein [Pseudomonadales bacterium]HJL61300.1 MoaD/ThiS family protein [Pseudomonadales bacterium]
MIKIKYLGSLVTTLKKDKDEVDWHAELADVAALIEALCADREEEWSNMLHHEDLLIAVNQSMVKTDHPLTDGDQVTFFPPMVGG